MEPVLPADIIYRKKKGFGVPLGRWFKEGKLPLRGPGLQALLNERFIQKARTQHESGTHDNRAFLWNYLMMESFLKRSDDKIDKFEN
jgi:asparagine synthase (glutamine-hydrolysing)